MSLIDRALAGGQAMTAGRKATRRRSRLSRWFWCMEDNHRPHVYETNIPGRVIVRCDCGRHVTPRLVSVEQP